MTSWSVSDARAALPEILDRVEAGEEAVITRHGKPVAVVVRPDALRARRAEAAFAQAAQLRRRLEDARRKPLPKKGLAKRRAEELVRDVRAGRDRA